MEIEDVVEMTRKDENIRLKAIRKDLGLIGYRDYIRGYNEATDYYIKLKEIYNG